MVNFYIDLNEYSSKKPRIIRLLIFGAIVCLGFTITSLAIFLTLKSSLEWFFLIAASYIALYIYFAWVAFKTNIFVKANDNGIVFKFGIRNGSKDYILWDSIKKVKIGPAYITFFKKSGRRKRVQLGWLTYSRVVEIKDKVVALCDNKGITYEVVDFIRYYKKKDRK
ncbi:MAG: hypothetical protein EHM93_14945 [Bacteroidales bacterium]|nr:MAG: hypothetical protein EHM93_14945 [Bacteroidales bacterium]